MNPLVSDGAPPHQVVNENIKKLQTQKHTFSNPSLYFLVFRTPFNKH